MTLFQWGNFTLHSGETSSFKIECDALTDEDIATIALMLVHRLPAFSSVEGVPRGGLRLAEAMKPFIIPGTSKLLIVDDVYTTGGSMEKYRLLHSMADCTGAVIFDRSLDGVPPWITPLWRLTP